MWTCFDIGEQGDDKENKENRATTAPSVVNKENQSPAIVSSPKKAELPKPDSRPTPAARSTSPATLGNKRYKTSWHLLTVSSACDKIIWVEYIVKKGAFGG